MGVIFKVMCFYWFLVRSVESYGIFKKNFKPKKDVQTTRLNHKSQESQSKIFEHRGVNAKIKTIPTKPKKRIEEDPEPGHR